MLVILLLCIQKSLILLKGSERCGHLHRNLIHVLPTPHYPKSSSTSSNSLSSSMLARGGSCKDLWHSSPLDKQKKFVNEPLSSHNIPKSYLATEDNKHQLPLPPRLSEAVSGSQIDSLCIYDGQKMTRQAFSGPLANKALVGGSGPNSFSEIYGSLGRSSGSQPPVPHIASYSIASDLHELPRPPDSLNMKAVRYVGAQRHSAPLVNRDREVSPTSRSVLSSNEGLPHLTVSRSFSISSSSTRSIFQSGKLFQSSSQVAQITEVISSLTTPLSLSRLESFNSRQI